MDSTVRPLGKLVGLDLDGGLAGAVLLGLLVSRRAGAWQADLATALAVVVGGLGMPPY